MILLISMRLFDIDIEGYETILLDRDGTINKLIKGDYVRRWNDFVFLPGALDAIKRFSEHAKNIIVVTNQRGVGRGLFTKNSLDDIHKRMCDEINAYGGRIDGIYYSLAIDDNDHNRKPNIGMFEQICMDFPDVKKETTLMIGDSLSDKMFADNCGIDFQMITE